MEYKFNSLQTELTDDILKDLDSSSISELYDCLSKIHLLQALSNPNRKYCRDLQRWDNPNVLDVRKPDKKGRIYVDLENPHILENMDYFRPAAKHFEEFGCYTKIFENPDPNSEYMKFWNEERRRCVEGYVREGDGEWIPGYLYHYWNYGRVQIKIKTGKKTAIQKEGFPELHDSDYWFAHYVEQAEDNGEFGFLLKKRRWGYSYKLQNMICRNYIHIKQSKNFILASEKEYIYKDGPQPKFKANLSFIEDNTPFWSPRLKDTDEHTKSGYKDKKLGIEKGRLSELICVTCKDDPDKGRGKSGKLVAFEEIGVFPGLEKTWTVAEESVKQGELVYGFMLGGGTGGTDGADFSSAEKMFYSPEGYNIKSMRNIYSKTNGTGVCSMFVPAYVSFEGLSDKNGNSDVIGALIKVITQRQKIRNATHDSQRLLQTKAEIPITPEEAVLRKEGSIFPVLDIKEYLSTIYPLEDKFCAPHYVGQLALNDDNSVKFCLNGNLIPVRHYPTKPDIDKTGALEIYEHPVFGNRDKYRYIAGCLPSGEKVLTKFGLKSVENINEEDCLINEDGNIVEVNKIYIHDVKDEDIYKLKVANTFRKTIFTKEHPILVSDAKFRYMNGSKAKRTKSLSKWNEFDFKYLKCEDVKVGQWTKVPNMYKVEKDVDFNNLWDKVNVRYDFEVKNPLNNDEFWWFVGLWFGDGWCENDNHSISVSFNAKEIMYMRRFEEFALKVLERKVSKTVKNNCVECKICCSKLHRFMSSNFGRYAFGKTIPEWVKYLDRGKKIKLIQGYLDSDGCITKNKYGLYSTEFVSINYELLESFQDILFSIGIISSITRMRGSKSINILGSKVNQKECFHLRIAHSFSVKLCKYIGQDNDHKLLRIDFNNIPTTRRCPNIGCYFDQNEDYIYFKIESVEKSKYTGTVYNFECETHTFLCKNITTHNCDPIENDEVLWSVSLASVFVFDRFTRRIVAEYTGRPSTNDYFEICYRLALYYNATIMYENNKKGLFGYFQLAKKALHMLADYPQHLADKQEMKPRAFTGNTAKGYTSTPEIKRYGRRLQADWLLETAYTDLADLEYDDDGNPINKNLALNIHKIRSIGYLEECSQWNPDGNFDRVDAMTAVLIYDAELGQYEQKVVKERVKTLADDPFFRRTEKMRTTNGLLKDVYHV